MFFFWLSVFVAVVLIGYGFILYFTSPERNREAQPDWSADTGFIDWRGRR